MTDLWVVFDLGRDMPVVPAITCQHAGPCRLSHPVCFHLNSFISIKCAHFADYNARAWSRNPTYYVNTYLHLPVIMFKCSSGTRQVQNPGAWLKLRLSAFW